LNYFKLPQENMADQVILMVASLFGLKNDHSIQYLMKIIWEQVYYVAFIYGSLGIPGVKCLFKNKYLRSFCCTAIRCI